jgi:murein DD-endopeptidase MepM/ murein hydrolase activator NlpD
MRQTAFWSGYGRGALSAIAAAACLGLVVAGCSSSSRLNLSSFSLTGSDDSSADLNSTSSLPPVLPEESVYGSANPSDGGFARTSLPPAYSPQPSTAAYSPAPSGRVRAPEANYPAPPAIRPATLRTGQGPGLRVKVANGDTLSVLSRRYGVPVEAIMSANKLPDGRLAVGQELWIPGVKAPKVAAASPAPAPKPKPAKLAAPIDTAEAEAPLPEASAAEASPSQAASAAPDASAEAAAGGTAARKVKTETILPPGAKSLAEEEEANAAPATADGKPGAKPAAGKQQDTSDVAASREITGEEKPRVANAGQLPTPDPMSGNSFRWPVKGRVISQFGARPDGGHNDGIDLAVPQGTSVQAAENGVVAYAGSELKGYGNLVLIRHANNWVSAYAHNEEILVKRGDKVNRGQIIAKAGASGAVSQPLVHFELRKGSRPVNPTKYMSDATAAGD